MRSRACGARVQRPRGASAASPADVVLTDEREPFVTVAAIQRAIDAGTDPRDRAIAWVKRMIAAKRLVGNG